MRHDQRCAQRDMFRRRCRTIAGHMGNDRAFPPYIRTKHQYTPFVHVELPQIRAHFVLRVWKWQLYPTKRQRTARIRAILKMPSTKTTAAKGIQSRAAERVTYADD